MAAPGRFNGRVAVITGGASGIGLASAKQILAENGKVALIDQSDASLDAAKSELVGHEGRCCTVLADVSETSSLESAAKKIVASFGRVDVLVNSAGILRWGGTADTTESDWDALMRVNVKGTWLASRTFIPSLLESTHASIVNVASNMGVKGVANQVAYSASKGAIIALTRSMAVDLGAHGIRVNCVNPGHIQTPMGNSAAQRLGLTEDGIRSKYPLGRVGEANEVASVIAFLASEDAAFMSGAIVAVDGGYTA